MATVRKVIESFDGSEELASVQREAVNALAQLGQTKAELFLNEIKQSLLTAGKGDNLTVPVSSVVDHRIEVRAFSASETANIEATVRDSLKGLLVGGNKEGVTGSMVQGLAELSANALSHFLGNSVASTGTIEHYYIATEDAAIVRLDIKSWYMDSSATSIKNVMQKVSATVCVKSIVDLTKVDVSTFVYLFNRQLASTSLTVEALAELIKKAKEIMALYRPTTVVSSPQVIAILPG